MQLLDAVGRRVWQALGRGNVSRRLIGTFKIRLRESQSGQSLPGHLQADRARRNH
jgi:hypothetical protein